MPPPETPYHLPLNFWVWVSRGSVVAILVFGLLGVMANFLPKIHAQEQAVKRMEELSAKEHELRDRRDNLRNQKVLIQSDALFIEEKSRDRLNLKKPGEEIYRFEEVEKAGS